MQLTWANQRGEKYPSIYILFTHIVHAFSIKSFVPDCMTGPDAIRSALVHSFQHIYRTPVCDWLTSMIYRGREKRISIYLQTAWYSFFYSETAAIPVGTMSIRGSSWNGNRFRKLTSACALRCTREIRLRSFWYTITILLAVIALIWMYNTGLAVCLLKNRWSNADVCVAPMHTITRTVLFSIHFDETGAFSGGCVQSEISWILNEQ